MTILMCLGAYSVYRIDRNLNLDETE